MIDGKLNEIEQTHAGATEDISFQPLSHRPRERYIVWETKNAVLTLRQT